MPNNIPVTETFPSKVADLLPVFTQNGLLRDQFPGNVKFLRPIILYQVGDFSMENYFYLYFFSLNSTFKSLAHTVLSIFQLLIEHCLKFNVTTCPVLDLKISSENRNVSA